MKYPNFPMMFSRGFFVWSAILVPSRCVRDEKSTESQRKINEKSTKITLKIKNVNAVELCEINGVVRDFFTNFAPIKHRNYIFSYLSGACL